MALHLEGKLRGPVAHYLANRGFTPVFEVQLSGYCDVVAARWNVQTTRRIPAIDETWAVELKLHDVAGVLMQAHYNRAHVDFSWCAMPESRIAKMKDKTKRAFLANEVGLLGVSENGIVRVVIPAFWNNQSTARIHKRKTLWRRRNEWKTRLDSNRVEREEREGG